MLGKVIRIMEMNDTLFVGSYNICGKQNPLGNIFADLAGHIVTLDTVDRRVLVGVFLLDFLIVALDKA